MTQSRAISLFAGNACDRQCTRYRVLTSAASTAQRVQGEDGRNAGKLQTRFMRARRSNDICACGMFYVPIDSASRAVSFAGRRRRVFGMFGGLQ